MLKRFVPSIALATFLLLGALSASASIIPQLSAGIAEFPDSSSLRLYFSTSISPVTNSNVKLALNGENLNINSISRVGKSGGVSYLLLVDVSGSMKEHMIEAKGLLNAIVSDMGPNDRAQIATIGLKTIASNFTGSKTTLGKKIAELSATNADTSLYRGIDNCLKLLTSCSSKSTGQKVLVVVSDGDENDNSGITCQEVTRTVTSSRIPVFTYLTLPKNSDASLVNASKVFSGFARSSAGGVDYSSSQKPASAGADILSSVQNEYMLSAAMPSDGNYGKALPLMLTVSVGGTQLSDTYCLTIPDLLPITSSPNVLILSNSDSSQPDPNVVPANQLSADCIFIIGTFKVTTAVLISLIIAVTVLIIAAILLVVFVRKSQKEAQKKDMNEDDKETDGTPPNNGGNTIVQEISAMEASETAVNTAPARAQAEPKPAVRVRLIRINDSKKPESFEFSLENTVTLGRAASKCDLGFENDAGMSGQHCQLINLRGKVYITDLGSTNGTFVNGVPIMERYKLESDDIINIGTTELRVVIEKTRTEKDALHVYSDL